MGDIYGSKLPCNRRGRVPHGPEFSKNSEKVDNNLHLIAKKLIAAKGLSLDSFINDTQGHVMIIIYI